MKKIFLIVPIVALIAAGCNTAQPITQEDQTNQQEEVVQNPTPTPTPATQTTPTPSPTPTTPTTYKTYTNSEYKFSIQYPSTFSIKTAGAKWLELPDQTYNYLGGFGLEMALVTIPKSALPKNSGVGRAEVLVSVDNSGGSGVYSFSAVDKNQGTPPPTIETLKLEKTVTINGTTWGLARKTGAAAGTYSNISVYHTYQNNTWYEVQLIMSGQSSLSDGSSADTSKVEQDLQDILSKFKFTK